MPLVIETPQLWWPNGFGSQPLYTVITELTSADGKQIYDRTEKRIGLRTMTMNTEKDAYGNAFAHVVNGVEIFAMGADYIPEDNILHRMNSARTRDLLQQCKAANFNCIRVWGGGLYPDDSFFDICDELGLMVWQDFMFACANYRLTEDFEENIMAELKDQIRRLAHHASLGLWCGNNEMEMFVDQGEWGAKNEIKSDYVKIYEYLFPKLLKKEDPDRFYWPVASWSSIDYYGRWKALHYYAKRFFAPVLLSCEEGLLNQTMNVNAEPFPVKKSIRLNVTNETMQEKQAVVKWQLRDPDAKVLCEQACKVTAPPLSAMWLDRVDLEQAELYANYVSYQLLEDNFEEADKQNGVVSEGTVLFCPPKHFRFADPQLRVRIEGDEIVVSASAYAKSIEIRNDNDDLILSDNFFDLSGGEKRVKVLKGKADGIQVRSVYDIR